MFMNILCSLAHVLTHKSSSKARREKDSKSCWHSRPEHLLQHLKIGNQGVIQKYIGHRLLGPSAHKNTQCFHRYFML
jgi:hypothetical protein